jgi:hypothetical protein
MTLRGPFSYSRMSSGTGLGEAGFIGGDDCLDPVA